MSLLLAGKLKTLIDRLTSTRAGNLDNIDSTTMAHIDADISSRAPSATALSTATWTATKAGYLNAPIGSIPTSIASVQSGSQTLATGGNTTDVTISAVNTSKTLVYITAANDATTTDDPGQYHVRATLTSTTNLRLYRAAFGQCNVYVSYYVVSFN